MEVNNQETPKIEGQGNEADNTEVVDETTEPVEAEETTEEGKGKPDDPKLMRKKMTQSDQRAAKAEKDLAEMKSKMEKMAEDLQGKEPDKEKGLKREQMNDQQKQIYDSMKEYMGLYLEEMGMTPKEFKNLKGGISQDRQANANKSMLDNFYKAHPETLADNVNQALADIITEGAGRGERIHPETALLIYNAKNGKPKPKETDGLEDNINGSLLKPKSTNVGTKVPGKMSKRQAVLNAMDSTPE